MQTQEFRELAKELKDNLSRLQTKRQNWESHWQEVADYMLPRKSDINKERSKVLKLDSLQHRHILKSKSRSYLPAHSKYLVLLPIRLAKVAFLYFSCCSGVSEWQAAAVWFGVRPQCQQYFL